VRWCRCRVRRRVAPLCTILTQFGTASIMILFYRLINIRIQITNCMGIDRVTLRTESVGRRPFAEGLRAIGGRGVRYRPGRLQRHRGV
jgi:hypothetical protein